MPQTAMSKKLKLNSSENYNTFLNYQPKNNVFFIVGDWNAKVGSQEIPGITGKFGLGGKMKQDKGSQSFAKRRHSS